MWLGMAWSLATAAIAPIVGSMSDLLGRRYFGICGSLLIMIGMIIVGVARSIELAIAGMGIAGLGSGMAQVIGTAGIAELAPVKSRGTYIGSAFVLVLPFGASSVWGRQSIVVTDDSTKVFRFIHLEMGCLDLSYSWWSEFPSVVNILFSSTSRKFPWAQHKAGPPADRHNRRTTIIRRIIYILTGSAVGRVHLVHFSVTGSNSSPWTSAQVVTTIMLGIFLLLVFCGWENSTLYSMIPTSLFAHKVYILKKFMLTEADISFDISRNHFGWCESSHVHSPSLSIHDTLRP